jgi:hypothetical protein
MSEDKPEYILKPGQVSLEKRYGEETTRITITLPKSLYDYIMDRQARGMPASEYLRRLIAQDMEQK